MVDSLNRRYVFCIFLYIYVYILFSCYIYNSLTLDYIFLSVLLYLLWYITFNKRSFLVTYELLDRHYHGHEDLEWAYEGCDGVIDKLFIRIGNEDYWREVESGLLYLSGVDIVKRYDSIKSIYKTTKQLEDELRFRLSNHKDRKGYVNKVNRSNIIKWVSLFILLIITYVFWITYLGGF